MPNADTTYTTKDFYLAVLLKTKGYELLSVDQAPQGHINFVFNLEQAAGEAICFDFWQQVPEQLVVREFVENIKTLKGLLHSVKSHS